MSVSAHPQPVEVFGENVVRFSTVRIKNAKNVQVFSAPCGLQLELVNVEGGSVTPLQSDASDERDASGLQACDVTLSLRHSEMDKIDCAFLSAVDLSNSTVKRLHGGTLKMLNMSSTSVNHLDNLNITGSGSMWHVVDFHALVNVTFMAPVEVIDIHVGVTVGKFGLLLLSSSSLSLSGIRSNCPGLLLSCNLFVFLYELISVCLISRCLYLSCSVLSSIYLKS